MSSILQEIVRIKGDDSSLVRLSNVGKDDVHHTWKKAVLNQTVLKCAFLTFRMFTSLELTNKHAVFVRVSCIFNDGNNVGSLFCHIQQVSAWSVGELDSVHQSLLREKK